MSSTGTPQSRPPSKRRQPKAAPSQAIRTRNRNRKPRRDPVKVAHTVLSGIGLVNLQRRERQGADGSEIATSSRIRVCERLLAAGLTMSELQVWAEQEWGLGEVSVAIIIEKMRDRWRAHDATEIPNLRAKYRRALQLVQQQAMAEMVDGPRGTRAQHARNLLKCIDQLCRLDGVYEPDVVQVNIGATPELEEVADALDNLSGLIAMARERAAAPPLDVAGVEVPALPEPDVVPA